MNDDRRLTAGLAAVSQACDVARRVQRDLERVKGITKDDKSPVTVADFAVQAVVAMMLYESLGSGTLIVGEEHTQALRTADQKPVLDAVVEAVRRARPDASAGDVLRGIDLCDHDAAADAYWTLDPIDGTKGFLRGQQYAIALAHIERGEVALGVMGCPNLPADHDASLESADAHGCIYTARRGGGAWEQIGTQVEGSCRRIHAAAEAGIAGIRACESVEAAHSKHDDVERVVELAGGKDAARSARLDSQCKYAVVARGQADAYLRMPTKKGYVEKIWDHAAGMLIAQEAGAIVTDIAGAPLDFARGRTLERNRGIVCASAGVHRRLTDAIAELRIGAAV
ncbi:MAG TPA: 3'(2'),5'-bisphosphate nucleotidase [Phycisphaerales bacterium]|nr:3'(2'),5'-bisphosphate nucleotidase [Phycisphaerales bacterium]